MKTHVADGPVETGVLIVTLPAVAKMFYRVYGCWGSLTDDPAVVVPVLEFSPVRLHDGTSANVRIAVPSTGSVASGWASGVWHPRRQWERGLYVIDGFVGTQLTIVFEAGSGGPGEGTMHGVIKYKLMGE